MDREDDGAFIGKTLMDLSENPENITIGRWVDFYNSINEQKMGCLPFRVWQIYGDMVGFLKQGDVDKFLCSAGILSHYVGDACQPLHVSQYHDGIPPKTTTITRNGEPIGKGVHTEYGTHMLDKYAPEIVSGINAGLQGQQSTPEELSGKDAAIYVIELMRKTISTLPPLEIVNSFINNSSGSDLGESNRVDEMFKEIGQATIQCMQEGCLYLATLWDSAWKMGQGDSIVNTENLVKRDTDVMRNIYQDNEFLKSLLLSDPQYQQLLTLHLI